MSHKGLFITLEGVDGCGKSTQLTYLVKALESAGHEVVQLRDPGSTRLSERVRLLLLDPANDDMSNECELMLYEAARAQLVREVIEPALERGAVVVCDRFCDSTLAYQAGGRGLPSEMIRSANAIGSCGLAPDVTLLFDLDPGEALARGTQEGADRLEGQGPSFMERARAVYRDIAQQEPERVKVIDASGPIEVVRARVNAALRDKLAR
ncbi:MAG: dTMP kinase [Coriobacteriales bacterium]|nr:dTMP kinase [Coriobacteriales bacterium]